MDTIEESYRYLTLKRIEHIFSIASEAVELDNKGEYDKAISLYLVCTTLISSEINAWENCYDESVLDRLKLLKDTYSRRVDQIRIDQLESYSSGCTIQTDGVDYSRFAQPIRPSIRNLSTREHSNSKNPVLYKLKKMLDIIKYDDQSIDDTTMLPIAVFDIDGAVIPMFAEKMELCRCLSSISFNASAPSILLKSIETIFNALYRFKIQACDKIHYDVESEELTIIPKQNKKTLQSISYADAAETHRESNAVLSKSELQDFQYMLKKSLETLVTLDAFRVMATEKGVKTEEEKEEDQKTLEYVKNCTVLLNDVYIPLFTADLHYLMNVYVDYRKRMLLTISHVCSNTFNRKGH